MDIGTITGRASGKTSRAIAATREAVNRGEHVHIASRQGTWCIEGPGRPADCTLTHRTMTQTEQQLRR